MFACTIMDLQSNKMYDCLNCTANLNRIVRAKDNPFIPSSYLRFYTKKKQLRRRKIIFECNCRKCRNFPLSILFNAVKI